jgi:hypothetical protein
MNTLYSCLVERRHFGDLLSAEGMSRLDLKLSRDVQSLSAKLNPFSQSVVAVWSQEPRAVGFLPDLLICKDGEERDWAAWITTFGAKIRPFTAFTRLITRSVFENLVAGERTPSLGHLTWPIAGLILGEVLAASGLPDKSLETMPANACESTLSFAMFRAAARYTSFRQWPQLVESWEFVRQATRQHQRMIESDAVARVCATIMEASDLNKVDALLTSRDRLVLHACYELITSPGSAPASLLVIKQFSSIEERMYGPREDRVVAFSEFIRDLERGPGDSELTSFMLGYLASRIAPGTIQHSSVLRPLSQRYATALLWYGFCAGFAGPETNTSRIIVGGRRSPLDLPASARRVARDLTRPESILGTPTCDIAFLELLALSKTGGDLLSDLIRTTQGTATVELAPGVSTVVNVSSKSGPEDSLRPAKEKDIIATMGEYIERLTGAYNELVKSDVGDAGQRTLFPQKRKKH